MSTATAERFFLELTEHTLILARVTLGQNPVIEDLREIWLGDPAALETALREAKPAGAPDAAVALLHPRSRAYFRANPHQAATVTTPEAAQYFLESMLGADGAAAVWSWVSPRDGRPPAPGQPWIIEATRPETSDEAIVKLTGWTFRVERAQSATFSLAGALVSIAATGRTLLCDFTDAHTNLFSISAQGIDATATVPGGFDTLAESTQAALALKFRGSAARLLFNESYDFSETSSKIVAPLADIIQLGLAQMGSSAPSLLVCSGLAASQRWIVEALGKALGITPLTVDGAAWSSSQGLILGAHVAPQSISPAWLGILNAIAHEQSGTWQIELSGNKSSPAPSPTLVRRGQPEVQSAPPVQSTLPDAGPIASPTPLTSNTAAPFARPPHSGTRPTIASNSRQPTAGGPTPSNSPLASQPPSAPIRPTYSPPPAQVARHIPPIAAAPPVKGSITPIIVTVAILLAAIGTGYYFLHKSQTEAMTKVIEAAKASAADAEAKAAIARKTESERILNARGSLTITSDPLGALVEIEGREPVQTPARISDLRLGRYLVKVTSAGFEPEQREIEIKENTVTDAGRISLRPIAGTIAIVTQPERLAYEIRPLNAQSDRNNTRSGLTPETLNPIPVGDYEVVVSKPAWRPYTTTVSVTRGNTSSINVNLSSDLRAQRTGKIITLTWQLPQGTYRGIEIMRNTTPNITSRDRVGIGRDQVGSFNDSSADPSQAYWYWVKVTYPDGKNDNIGPVEVPATQ